MAAGETSALGHAAPVARSRRPLSTSLGVVAAMLIIAYVMSKFVNGYTIERFFYERFGLVPAVQVSFDGLRTFHDLDDLDVTGRFDGQVDAASIRIVQPNGSAVYVAFVGRENLARLRAARPTTLVSITADRARARVAFP